MARTVERWGSLDTLFHCAVDVPFVNNEDGRITELPDEVWQRMLDLVLTGTFNCAKHAGRQMIAQGSGSIILTATTDALIGCAGLDAYTAAKGGVVALTRSFAAGIARDGVRVNAICPSFVTSEPQREWLVNEDSARAVDALHLLPVPSPEEIAPLVVYLASDEAAAMTGRRDPDRQRLHGVQGQPRHRRSHAGAGRELMTSGAVATPSRVAADGAPVKSADRVMAVLDLVAERGAMPFSEIAEALALPKSSAHSLLRTMEARGYVAIDDERRYRLGSRIWELAQAFHEVDDLRTLMKPLMDEVVERTGETVQLAILEGVSAVYLALSESPHPMKLTSRAGARLPAYTSAIGKTLLASLDRDEAARRLDGAELDAAHRPHDRLRAGAARGARAHPRARLRGRQRGVRDRAALHRGADPRPRREGGRGDLGLDADTPLQPRGGRQRSRGARRRGREGDRGDSAGGRDDRAADMTATEVAPRIHRIDSIMGTRLLSQWLDARRRCGAALGHRDRGDDARGGRAGARGARVARDELAEVIVSHADVDHYGGNAEVRELFGEARLRAHALDRPLIESWDRIAAERYGWYRAHGLDYPPETWEWLRAAAGADTELDGAVGPASGSSSAGSRSKSCTCPGTRSVISGCSNPPAAPR